MHVLQLVADPDLIPSMAVEELGYLLLEVASKSLQNGLVHREVIVAPPPHYENERDRLRYDAAKHEMPLLEALHWLETQGLVVPAPGMNGTNGFRVLSRRGRDLLERSKYQDYMRAAAFPKALLHPSIADRVWVDLARGDYQAAVFFAFRTVEEAVREAGGYGPGMVGVELMRAAFDPDKGPLCDTRQHRAEAGALAHLFSGSIGSYKNPHSHRTVTIGDPLEAQEMVMLASHLLRIVDARRALRKVPAAAAVAPGAY